MKVQIEGRVKTLSQKTGKERRQVELLCCHSPIEGDLEERGRGWEERGVFLLSQKPFASCVKSWLEGDQGKYRSGGNPSTATYQFCDLGQVAAFFKPKFLHLQKGKTPFLSLYLLPNQRMILEDLLLCNKNMIIALREIHSGWRWGLKEVEASQVWTIWKSFMEELAFRQEHLHELIRLTLGGLLVGNPFPAMHKAKAKVWKQERKNISRKRNSKWPYFSRGSRDEQPFQLGSLCALRDPMVQTELAVLMVAFEQTDAFNKHGDTVTK